MGGMGMRNRQRLTAGVGIAVGAAIAVVGLAGSAAQAASPSEAARSAAVRPAAVPLQVPPGYSYNGNYGSLAACTLFGFSGALNGTWQWDYICEDNGNLWVH